MADVTLTKPNKRRSLAQTARVPCTADVAQAACVPCTTDQGSGGTCHVHP